MLIVFGGLPGTGKTTLARTLAQARGAVYLRIDTIEQRLRSSGTPAGDVGPAGYLVAYALAEANLRIGHVVVADSVNPLLITRQAWRDVAAAAGATVVEIEIVCSDRDEHRRRVETRSIDVVGFGLEHDGADGVDHHLQEGDVHRRQNKRPAKEKRQQRKPGDRHVDSKDVAHGLSEIVIDATAQWIVASLRFNIASLPSDRP